MLGGQIGRGRDQRHTCQNVVKNEHSVSCEERARRKERQARVTKKGSHAERKKERNREREREREKERGGESNSDSCWSVP